MAFTPKILAFAGSLRADSYNKKLVRIAAEGAREAGAEVTCIDLRDYPLPIYDGDLQMKSGVPKNAVNLKRMMASHHGVLLVTPEYNSSVPPLLKNAIDWVTRVQDAHEGRGQVFRERAFALNWQSLPSKRSWRIRPGARSRACQCENRGSPHRAQTAFQALRFRFPRKIRNAHRGRTHMRGGDRDEHKEQRHSSS